MTNYAKASSPSWAACRRPWLLRVSVLAALAMFMPHPVAAQTTAYQTLYSFQGSPDGADPTAAVIIGKNGALYGTTYEGGASKVGTAFVLAKPTGEPWKETVLYSFGSDGSYPRAPLVFGRTGALYGTLIGGSVIFELTPPSTAGSAWTQTTLYTVSYLEAMPNGPLLFGPGGTIYATTEGAPASETGQIIALAPPTTPGGAWTESVLYAFGGAPDGSNPTAGVVSEGGSLFGTTLYGGDEFCFGPYGCGVAYKLTPPTAPGGAWTETILHTFGEVSDDGIEPMAPLTVGPGGVLYGTTEFGGPGTCLSLGGPYQGCGTVFQLTPPAVPGGTWTESILHNFGVTSGDGVAPVAGVVMGKNGDLYGTTQWGGSAASASACPEGSAVAGCGIVFELTPPSTPGGAWTETVLHSFSGQDGDGAISQAALTLSSSGVLYGTTSAGGTAGKGTVFSLVP